MSDTERILIVEDEGVTALDIEDMLIDLGYEVSATVDTGEKAISKAKETAPDLILMDINLKGEMDGISAAEQILEDRFVPIVFLTSYSDEKTLGRAKLLKPYGYVLKPFEQDDLRTAISLALFRAEAYEEEAESSEQKVAGPSHQLVLEGHSEQQQFLARVDPFRSLPESLLNQLANASEFKHFPSQTLFIDEGSEEVPHFVVVSGRVSCIKTSPSGKQLVVSLLGPGEVMGVFTALDPEPYPYTMRVESDSTVLILGESTLKSVFEAEPLLYKEACELMVERLRASDEMARQLAHDKVEVRICSALLSLNGVFGKRDRETSTYSLQITRQELADVVGTSVETAIRITKTMEAEGTLDLTTPGTIVITDISALCEKVEAL